MSSEAIHPFPYDAFQQRAIDAIEGGASVFVAAPTGAGKTVLADYVIERTLREGARVIYTAPIKALSNQKFRDFSVRHPEQVGILTGDVTINPTAPLLIMTTEIYRNTLLENPSRLAAYAWIIFDEIHYLDDPERGTVWEEALLFTPAHINILALSATIPNVNELAGWIRSIHGRPVEVIEEARRPVPLHVLFQCQDQLLDDAGQLKELAQRHQPRLRGHRSYHDRRQAFGPSNRLSTLLRHLQEAGRLPCIFFAFGRRRAEDLAWEAAGRPLATEAEARELREMYDDLCRRFEVSQEPSAQALRQLIEKGIAYHHAGMLPTMKEVIERCFVSRRVKLIVTTETFALGINMPARSVVLDALKKRADYGIQLLRRREFLQMAGRAGRRGMDEAGYVYLRINPAHVTPAEVQQVLQGEPEPVTSRFNTTYATLLNLYREHGRELLAFFPKTFYACQTSGPRRQAGLELMERKLALLESLGYLTPKGLTHKGQFSSWLYGYELLLGELHEAGRLEHLDPIGLALLLLGIAYEPRPRREPGKAHRLGRHLTELCHRPLLAIHHAERTFRVRPITKSPSFILSRALEAWLHKTPFSRLTRLVDADEGELVRYFRMTVQLLRQLMEAPGASEALRATAEKAMVRINRDVVDAEAQLRLG
ncbi:MAG: DEAD/DEAH box helicase [Candidatus Omnitrophica bacterium]|nr:DEAD/DEAH box helicase [Candidatus Omnitrophota bacterium]